MPCGRSKCPAGVPDGSICASRVPSALWAFQMVPFALRAFQVPFGRSRWFQVPTGPCIVHWQDGIAPYIISVLLSALGPPEALMELRRLWNARSANGTASGPGTPAALLVYCSLAGDIISVLISIAQHILFLSLLIDRLHTYCILNAYLMQSLRKIHLHALY